MGGWLRKSHGVTGSQGPMQPADRDLRLQIGTTHGSAEAWINGGAAQTQLLKDDALCITSQQLIENGLDGDVAATQREVQGDTTHGGGRGGTLIGTEGHHIDGLGLGGGAQVFDGPRHRVGFYGEKLRVGGVRSGRCAAELGKPLFDLGLQRASLSFGGALCAGQGDVDSGSH
jgi:hypothetical protein